MSNSIEIFLTYKVLLPCVYTYYRPRAEEFKSNNATTEYLTILFVALPYISLRVEGFFGLFHLGSIGWMRVHPAAFRQDRATQTLVGGITFGWCLRIIHSPWMTRL